MNDDFDNTHDDAEMFERLQLDRDRSVELEAQRDADEMAAEPYDPWTVTLDVWSDVFAGPVNEDGERPDELAFYVRATFPNGRRFAHVATFTTLNQTCKEAEAKAQKLLYRVTRAITRDEWNGPVNSPHWTETYPEYGSAYYQSSDAEAEWAAQERRMDQEGR